MMNTPKKYVDVKSADTLRAAVENQGKWVYFLTNEGLDNGLSDRFAKDAMSELGEYYAEHDYGECHTIKEFSDKLMNRTMEQGHEAEILSQNENGIELKVGYCPMLNMWNQLCNDDEKKKMLCDVACSLYRGLADKKGLSFEKKSAIAYGCESCSFCFEKNNGEK